MVLRPRFNFPYPNQVIDILINAIAYQYSLIMFLEGFNQLKCLQVNTRDREAIPGGFQTSIYEDGESSRRDGGERVVFHNSVHEVGSSSGTQNEEETTPAADGQDEERPLPDPIAVIREPGKAWSFNDGWVVYATHPRLGQYVVNEGVVLVGDRYVITGGVRQGFFVNVMPAPEVEVRSRSHKQNYFISEKT